MEINYKRHFKECKRLNAAILKKYDKNKKVSFEEAYIFHLTSNLMSYTISKIENKGFNLYQCFNIRCIIESLVILKMNSKGCFSEGEKELLEASAYVKEYQIYNKFNAYDKKIFDLDEMKYNNRFFSEKFKDNDIKFDKFQPIPWLKENHNYEELINTHLGQLLKCYKSFSTIIHPSVFSIRYEFIKKVDVNDFESFIYSYIDDLYSKYHYKMKDEYSYDNMYKLYISDGTIREPILSQFKKIKKEYININPKINNEIIELFDYFESMYYDYALGMTEIIKGNFKSTIEQRAFEKIVNKYDLLGIYNKFELSLVEELDVTELKKELLTYSKNIKFKNLFNYSYSKMVNDYIDKYIKTEYNNSLMLKSEEEFGQNFTTDYFKILYEEGELLSHGNGYLLYSNNGAFQETANVLIYVLSLIINKIKIEEPNISKKLEELINYFILNHSLKTLMINSSKKVY